MKNSAAVFLQARISSTRLPAKALLPLAGKPIISHAMEALTHIGASFNVLLTDKQSAPLFKEHAEAAGFDMFIGPRDDVLKRFSMAADKFGPSHIIRATGDNPLVDPDAAKLLLAEHIESSADYSGFDGPPIGTGVEILAAGAMKIADRESFEKYDREHVSPFLYRNPARFKINRLRAPEEICLDGCSVSIDTRADYDYVESLFNALYEGHPLKCADILPWLREKPIRSHQ